ncbi:hypothetical protein QAD02_014111 [Eretmocerus hayati]|uniref:Uncharacterized protein n=1 Tax=Eretmocerus hayati TaxID=131215 RepID=A0ACC2P3Z9_9HYME|nr:hypothetical protein QAD02_014111 [Eretmocerus hayati]
MNSLVNYVSDGENSTNSESCQIPATSSTYDDTDKRLGDAVYDAVPMDMSEESNDHSSEDSNGVSISVGQQPYDSHQEHAIKHGLSLRRLDTQGTASSHKDHKYGLGDRLIANIGKSYNHDSDKKEDHRKRLNECKDKGLVSDKDAKTQSRDANEKSRDLSRRKDRCDRSNRSDEKIAKTFQRDVDRDRDNKEERDNRRDRVRYNDRDREKDRDGDRNREHRHKDRSKDGIKERSQGTERNRDLGRDRRYTKDEKMRGWYRDCGRSKDREEARTRSRSKDRKLFISRGDRNKNKLAQLEKLGIELKPIEDSSLGEKNFYSPLATADQGKYAEQIQKRKLLWSNKKEESKCAPSTSTANTWVGTTFTHDDDGKVTAKFKRLMGIKGDLPAIPAPATKPDILKKQEEMFTNMEQQYEVARATTHTQRGVGLGYASGNFPFQR